jgi:GNAT superfamily N-acetyltransferase
MNADYLAALNACFPNWGGEAMFDWAFRGADLLEVRDGERLIAGSAVTYRDVRLPDGDVVRAAIMTGSFTLPGARGRGLFSRFIEESLAVSRKRDCAMLLAFVTGTNPSRRRLEAAGATMVPSFYCNRRPGLGPGSEKKPGHSPGLRCTFVYNDAEWQTQFINRPQPGRLIDGDGYRAVIDDARRLHYLDGNPRAIDELDVQFLFTTNAARIPPHFDATPGFLTILGDLRPASWDLHNGDRM